MNIADIAKPTLDKPRTAQDTDLVNAVWKIMDKQIYPHAHSWLAEPLIVEAVDKNAELQRFLICRNLRIKLGTAPVDTSIERFALDAQTTEKEWLNNLAKYVVPALLAIARTPA